MGRNNFYYRTEIHFFTIGFVVGMYAFILFRKLDATQYANWAWLLWGLAVGFIALSWGGSYILNRFAEIERELSLETPDSLQKKNLANQQSLDPIESCKLRRPQPSNNPETQIKDPLVFHSNKTLSLLHEAYEIFWLNHDPLRPPLQKQVTAFLLERGLPARQAAELAAAIKPDDNPKGMTDHLS